MSEEMSRLALRPGDCLELETQDFAGTGYRRRITITGLTPKGTGSTSIAYEAEEDKGDHKEKVIVKEFYPSWVREAVREGTALRFGPEEQTDERLERDRERFTLCWRMQEKLSGSDAMEIMVRSRGFARYGDSLYMISEMHRGDALRTDEPRTAQQIVRVMVLACELMDILHTNGYLFTDFAPENLLWIRRPEGMRLFDADSLLEEARVDQVAPEEVLHHPAYDSPQMETLGRCSAAEFEEKKKNYLDRSADVYKLGVLFFELLFGRLPGEGEKEPDERTYRALLGTLKKNRAFSGRGSAKTAQEIMRILGTFLRTSRLERYRSAKAAMDDLIRLQGMLQAAPYEPKKKTAGANAQLAFYRMLEAHPLYVYSRMEEETRILEMAVTGSRVMREQLLTIVISCAQMLGSELRIHLAAEDAAAFWADFSDRKKRPALAKAVEVTGPDGKVIAPFDGADLVERPLASIFLHDGDREELEKLADGGCRYFVVLEDEDRAQETVRLLRAKLKGQTAVIAYLRESAAGEAAKGTRPALFPIPRRKLAPDYNEKELNSRIDRMGRLIHAYYTKAGDPFANAERIESTYLADAYSRESSRRSAMALFYKMASVPGVDPAKPDAGQKFYDLVIGEKADPRDAGSLFARLEALEHLSWTAHMILGGARGVSSAEQLRSYLFIGDNDWKQKAPEGGVLRHPCVCASVPGRHLPAGWWEMASAKKAPWKQRLDPLEEAAVTVFVELGALTRRLEPELELKFAALEEAAAGAREDLAAAVADLAQAKEKCVNRDTDAGPQWRAARAAAGALVPPDEHLRLQELLAEIDALMRPVLAYAGFHDFKENDGVLIRAIPALFAAWKNGAEGIILIKPVSRTLWENLFSTLMIEPAKLILVPDEGEDAGPVRDKCEQFLKRRGLRTQVLIRDARHMGSLGRAAGRIFIDETGASGRVSRALARAKGLEGASFCYVQDRMLFPSDGDTGVALLNRPVRLTVPEVFDLHGADMFSRHAFHAQTKLSASQYKSLWTAYRQLHSGKKWKIVIDTLRRLEEAKRMTVSLKVRSVPTRYRTGFVEETDLAAAGMTDILNRLIGAGLLESCQVPEKGEYDVISYVTKYPELHEAVQKMVMGINRSDQVGADPFCFRPQYRMEDEVPDELTFVNTGLYTAGKVPHEQPDNIIGSRIFYSDEVLSEFFRLLARQEEAYVGTGTKRTIHLLGARETDGGTVFVFRYYSPAVQEVLEKEGSILETLIYRECRSKKIFDDVHMNVEFSWENGVTRNEVDVVGTKNGRTYFISAKMQEPQKAFLEEIDVLARLFGVEGVPVLVCSHYSTARRGGGIAGQMLQIGESTGSAVERRSSAMHVGWIGIDEIVREDAAGKETVVIGESLRRLVGADS